MKTIQASAQATAQLIKLTRPYFMEHQQGKTKKAVNSAVNAYLQSKQVAYLARHYIPLNNKFSTFQIS